MSNNFIQAVKNALDAFADTLNTKEPVCQTPVSPTTDNTDKDIPADATIQGQVPVTDEDQSKDSSSATVSTVPVVEPEPSSVDMEAKPADTCPTDTQDDVKQVQEDKPQLDLDNPEIRLKTALKIESGGYVLGCSIQGRSHISSHTPCQDYHAFKELGKGWMLAITSDGAGSAQEAARGSKANCELGLRLITQLLERRQWIEREHLPSEKEWYIEIRNVFETMQAIIAHRCNALAEQEPNNLSLEPRDFNATIIVLLLSPKGMMTAHIGDGRMGYLSKEGDWKPLMTPHKGDEACSTVFIPNNWNRQLEVPAFTMSDVYLPETSVVAERPQAFVLMSDGCESFSWNCKTYDEKRNFYYDRNTPFVGFLQPLIDYVEHFESMEERVDKMIEAINIGTNGGKKELDDRTLLLGVLADDNLLS